MCRICKNRETSSVLSGLFLCFAWFYVCSHIFQKKGVSVKFAQLSCNERTSRSKQPANSGDSRIYKHVYHILQSSLLTYMQPGNTVEDKCTHTLPMSWKFHIFLRSDDVLGSQQVRTSSISPCLLFSNMPWTFEEKIALFSFTHIKYNVLEILRSTEFLRVICRHRLKLYVWICSTRRVSVMAYLINWISYNSFQLHWFSL